MNTHEIKQVYGRDYTLCSVEKTNMFLLNVMLQPRPWPKKRTIEYHWYSIAYLLYAPYTVKGTQLFIMLNAPFIFCFEIPAF